MDQEKIGKLIAKLRRGKNLTQSQLGELVGVGFRAVSKWENGQTLPDISIINELSNILGVSTDELLHGELKDKITIQSEEVLTPTTQPKKKKLLHLIIPIAVLLIAAVIIIITANNNHKLKTEVNVYKLYAEDVDKYTVEGNITFDNDKMLIVIDELFFINKEFLNKNIKNYEYSLKSGDLFLVGQGYIDGFDLLDEPISIKEFTQQFKINYTYPLSYDKNEIIKNKLTLTLVFLDNSNNCFNEKIIITIEPEE